MRLREGLERRRADAIRLDQGIVELRRRIQDLRGNRPDREQVARDLTERFAALLAAFGFPKLDEPNSPSLDEKLFLMCAVTVTRRSVRPVL